MSHKMPLTVLCGGPAAVLAYGVTAWLLENEPEHWWIRFLRRTADRINVLTRRL